MMKFWAVVASMAVLTSTIHSSPNPTSKELPECALQCMGDSTIFSKTPASDTSICNNHEQGDIFELCVNMNCTIREVLTTKNITETICGHPQRNRTKTVSITGLVGVSLALLIFMLRILARAINCQFGMDDWTMITAMGFVIPLSAMAVVLAIHGLGKDIWSIPFDDITYILYIYYFDESLYIASLTMIKVSILYFYLRIFPQKTFRRIVYVIMVGSVVYGTAFVLLSVFQCIPVQAAWKRWDGTVQAKCIDANALGWTSAAVNIVLDVIILILPLPELSKLAMSWERKIHILLMFGLGSFVTVVSILRLTSLVKFANTQNITWDYVPVGYWSTIEVHVSVICACLPALPSLFRRKLSPAAAQHNQASMPHGSAQAGSEPKKRDSDVLPLLKLESGHQRGISH